MTIGRDDADDVEAVTRCDIVISNIPQQDNSDFGKTGKFGDKSDNFKLTHYLLTPRRREFTSKTCGPRGRGAA